MRQIVVVFFSLIAFSTSAQFQLNGVTTNLGGGVYQLTPALNTQFGAIWSKVQHDINTSFNVQGQMNFGADPGGADGIAFVMQNSCLAAGSSGGGLGYSGIPDSLFAVEFDTYQNIAGSGLENNFDPAFDHIAVSRGGDVVHNATSNDVIAPIQMDPVLTNVKTGAWYNFQINYNATTKLLRVFFNGSLRVNVVYDIKANAFPSAQQYVYWGFTSTTGGFNNIQQISINGLTTTHVLRDTTICTGSIPVVLPNLSTLRGTNLALNNPVFASSSSNGGANIAEAVDGNIGSRWESVWNIDPQWIYVDLQSPADLDSVVLYWEAARAKDYQIQTSADAVTWTTQFSTTTGSGTKDKIIFSATNVRYVRMYGTARLIGYGYSIWEFQVFGQPKYLWSTNNGTDATISPSVYSSSVTLTPTVTTTYSVLIPDPCVGYTTLSTTVTISCPAPVTILNFDALGTEQGVKLNWTTASEQNSDHFEILRSEDGINFYSIGKVNASGNSNVLVDYSFLDNKAYNGTVYYKIVSVDIDGSKQSSSIEAVKNDSKKAIVLSPVFEEETSLLLSGKVDYIQYSILDMVGREITNVSIQNPSESLTIGQELAPACYLLKLKTNNYSETIKICKVK